MCLKQFSLSYEAEPWGFIHPPNSPKTAPSVQTTAQSTSAPHTPTVFDSLELTPEPTKHLFLSLLGSALLPNFWKFFFPHSVKSRDKNVCIRLFLKEEVLSFQVNISVVKGMFLSLKLFSCCSQLIPLKAFKNQFGNSLIAEGYVSFSNEAVDKWLKLNRKLTREECWCQILPLWLQWPDVADITHIKCN